MVSMKTADIQKYFSINPGSGRTLTAQLEKRIARFIETHEDGTQLPPEETLAKVLNISRVTVRNALKPFLEKNQIIREVRKGTRIRKPAAAENPAALPDPLALGIVWRGLPKKTIRFLSFETLPLQQEFWNRVILEYSRKNPDIQVKIVPMTTDMLSENITSLLQEKQIDLFLYSHNYSEPLPELALPLPESLREQMTGPEYLSGSASFRTNPDYRYKLPLNISTAVVVWNKALAEQTGLKDIRRRLENGQLTELIEEAAPRLPEGCFASGHPGDLLAYAGCPVAGSETDQLKKQLFRIENILKTPRACITPASHTLQELIRKFQDGRILFFVNNTTAVFAEGEPAMPVEMLPVYPEPGCRNLIMSLDIALSRFTRKKEEAADFMRFLISEPVQKWTASIKRTAPIRRDNYYDFMKREFQYRQQQADNWLRCHKLYESGYSREENYHRFVIFHCREEMEDIAEGRSSAEKAASRLSMKFDEQLKTLTEAIS